MEERKNKNKVKTGFIPQIRLKYSSSVAGNLIKQDLAEERVIAIIGVVFKILGPRGICSFIFMRRGIPLSCPYDSVLGDVARSGRMRV